MKTSFKIFDFAGAPVNISLWFFLLFLFVPFSYVIAIFISVLIHELAHAYVANQRGWQVYEIRVDLFTGSASVDTNIPERDSIPVVAAGPLSNLGLAVLSLFLYAIFGQSNPLFGDFMNDFFIVNVFMFIFNILPIYPMDGGRLLKDFLFLKMRSNRRLARKIAGGVSLFFSIGLLVYSISIAAIIMAVFSALFIYSALIELGIISQPK
jgi:Zn-dependent protease